MNKNAIQRFAIWARKELIAQVSQRAYQYDITADGYGDYDAVAVGGRLLSEEERKQRKDLIHQIQGKGYAQVMEEVAYTWFNRFIALRFMEVNNYLPTHIRVFSDASGAFKPEILTSALHLDLPGLDMGKVSSLIEKNQTEDLYRYLLLTECNSLSSALPRMFEKMGSYTELLLPNNILRQEGVLGRMVADIPEEDWTDQVQIIGWLYQYYNTELKDDTFALLKKNVKITKERIPSATQLFTPDWIVRYMVENSLGRLWIEGHSDDELKAGWKYYLDEAEQEADVQAQLEEIRAEYRHLRPQDIKVIDPCMGSGHILVYAFDVLVQIYKRAGFSERDAAQSILENNLYGLDIDDRAAQLAYFAVMMKARQYDRRIFTRNIQPHVYAIVESNDVQISAMWRLGAEQGIAERLLEELKDAKEYGSILNLSLTMEELTALRKRLVEIGEMSTEGDLMDRMESGEIVNGLMPLVEIAEVLTQKYEAVVTNPPYMSVSNASMKLQNYVKKEFPDSKADLFAVFIERCLMFTEKNAFQAMITQHAWMFLSSFEKLREKIQNVDIVNMAHLGARAFEEIGGEVVQTASFVLRQNDIKDYQGTYCRLIEPSTQQGKEDMFLAGKNRYTAKQSNFSKIPGSPVAYWVSDRLACSFMDGQTIDTIGASRSGMQTGNNDLFLRFWFEVCNLRIKFNMAPGEIDLLNKWFPQPKGGCYRKWYGNLEYVVNFENDGAALRAYQGTSIIKNPQYYFREGFSWSHTTSKTFSGRYMPQGCIFNVEAPSFYPNKGESLDYILGMVNSKVLDKLFGTISQTMHYMAGDMAKIPIIKPTKKDVMDKIESMVRENISISRVDWDSFETSWDFRQHPLLPSKDEDEKIIFGIKVSEERWIRELKNGTICFGPVDDFIKQGEETLNQEQGDKYEGIFARLKYDDLRIQKMRDRLKDDLEEIIDDEYILLRRKSCKTIPVFSAYGIYPKNVKTKKIGDSTYQLTFSLDTKMVESFLESSSKISGKEPWGMGFSIGRFQGNVSKMLKSIGVQYRITRVQYDLFATDEFFIEPTDDYLELNHKAERYSYQNEYRIILFTVHQTDKFIKSYTPLSDDCANISNIGNGLSFKIVASGHEQAVLISDCYNNWQKECEERFTRLKANEDELNRIFIDIYGLQDELMAEVEEKDVTVRRANLGRDIRSLISYAVGCMFGRYSLDMPGLAYAGGEWDDGKYNSYIPDPDNIIPICDDDYFDDDITGRFVKWVEVVFGKKPLEENLKFIADALDGKGSSREVIRNYFLNDFYADHLKTYQKRPIYWLFDSGKKNGFKALIYMHRYQSDLLARLRTDYVHEQQERYHTQLKHIGEVMDSVSASERVKLAKQQKKLQEQALELQKYEEKIHHLADQNIEIDLDDGVKHNYAIFEDVLAKIK